jgi:hypothetical protein
VRVRVGERIGRRLGDDDADLAADVRRHAHVAGDVVGLDADAVAGRKRSRARALPRPGALASASGKAPLARRSSSSRVTRPFSTHSVARLVSERS